MDHEFRVVPHGILPNTQAVEFWRNDRFVASIYPTEEGSMSSANSWRT